MEKKKNVFSRRLVERGKYHWCRNDKIGPIYKKGLGRFTAEDSLWKINPLESSPPEDFHNLTFLRFDRQEILQMHKYYKYLAWNTSWHYAQ